jgi:hypothetical protein
MTAPVGLFPPEWKVRNVAAKGTGYFRRTLDKVDDAPASGDVLDAVVELALRWRYGQTAEFNIDQRLVDGLELLTLLQSHRVVWSGEYAATVTSARAAVNTAPPASPVVRVTANRGGIGENRNRSALPDPRPRAGVDARG